jgi:TPR repeat protein
MPVSAFPRSCRFILALAFAASSADVFAQDSKPILMSRTGGGSWSTPAELQASAKNGNPKACAQLGEALLRGDQDFPQDIPRALTLLEQAARAGQAPAAFRLGLLLSSGDHVALDRPRALAYFRAAAAGGSAEAFHNLGAAYSTGRGVKRDYAEALAWLILAKKHGTPGNSADDLRAHLKSIGRAELIPAGEKRALELERELAQASVTQFLPPPAPFASAAPVEDPSPPAALSPLPPPPALAPLAENIPIAPGPAAALADPKIPGPPSLASPLDALPADDPVKLAAPTGRIWEWPHLSTLQASANAGDRDALAALGKLLLDGDRLTADVPHAVALLERAAKTGSGDAAFLLAELYTKGLQAPRDARKAFAFTLQAAHGGVRTAAYNLGALYANGAGTNADYTEALAWLLVAQHFNLDSGQLARIRDYVAKTDAKQIPVAEKRAADRIQAIEATRANLPGL